jgi:adenylylsulfate kinase-like enzyme
MSLLCGPTDEESQLAYQQSKLIDEQIAQDKARRSKYNDSKLLLLGISGSGKSTVLKQFKVDKGIQFSDEERYVDEGMISSWGF